MKSHHRQLVTYLVLALLAIAVLGIVAKSFQTSRPGGQAALFLTQPVYSASGTVQKVDGDTITLVVARQSPLPPNSNPTTKISSPPKSETMVFTVKVDGATIYKRPSTTVPYLFGGSRAKPDQSTRKSVAVGQYITAETKTDLRTITKPEFTASVVNLPSTANVLSGVVTNINSNSMMVSTAYGEKQIAITSSTEISNNVSEDATKPVIPKKYSLSDIKSNSQVTIYTDKDATGNETLTALRIDPGMPTMNREAVTGGKPPSQPPAQPQSTMQQSSASIPAANPAADTTKVIPTLTMPTIDPQKYVQQ